VLLVGPNGAGKTNLLEALHVGTQGFSPRTRADAQLIRFGESAARIALRGRRGGEVPAEIVLTIQAGQGKRARLDGRRLPAAEQLRSELATLVFTPDRLAVVKGGPAVRRAYFDRALGRLLPARSRVPVAYAAALAQRGVALRRIAAGFSPRAALDPWTEQVAELGAALVAARRETVRLLAPAFRECADELGLAGADLVYAAEPPTRDELDARVDRDVERGATGLGPHLDDVTIVSGARDLRLFGSQGEQRVAVLGLVLGEATVLAERRSDPPLLLLDDVLSELDGRRRAALAARLPAVGQAVITATAAEALPAAPQQLLEVCPGAVRER
jgi:DNA replication and repair protein RecF